MKLFLLFLSFCIVGCGGEESGESSESNSFRIQASESLTNFIDTVELSSDTPEALGTLLVIHDGKFASRKVSACTWSLIDQEYAVTNSHCIPQALKDNKSLNCHNYLQGKISTGNGKSITVKCLKLVSFSKTDNSPLKNNDYALIKIEKVNVQPFGLSRVGISEGEQLKAATMDHDMSPVKIVSQYNPKDCTSESSDILGRIKSAGSSPITMFGDCKIIQGNSGSPVLNTSGDVVALVHASIKDKLPEAFGKGLDRVLVSNKIGVITNLKCFALGVDKFDLNIEKDCSYENDSDPKGKMMKKLIPLYETKVQEGRETLPKFIEFKEEINKYGSSQILSFTPKCIQPLKKWSADDIANIEKKGFSNKVTHFSIPSYVIKIQTFLDYYGNFDIELETKHVSYMSYKISHLEKLKKKKTILIEGKKSILGKAYNLNLDVPECSEEI